MKTMTDGEQFDLIMSNDKRWEETLEKTKEDYFQTAKWIVILSSIFSFIMGFCLGKM